MQRGRLTVDTDVRDVTTGTSECDRQFERGGRADSLDGDVGTEAVGELRTTSSGSSTFGIDDDVGAELLRGLAPRCRQIDGDDVARAVEPGARDRGEADRSGPDDRRRRRRAQRVR